MRLLISVLFLAQAATVPSFEVASITSHPLPAGTFSVARAGGGAAAIIKIAGNRVTATGNLKRLVVAAYNVKDFQVDGVPDAVGNDLYDIVAKSEGEATPTLEQVRPMLQALLADRFQLKFHRDTREIAVWDLVVGKNGPKLKETAGAKPPEDPVRTGSIMRFSFTDRTIPQLIDMLGITVDRPVLDKTGLTGHYDFSLEIDGEHLKEIEPAIEDLGLKLSSAKEPVEVLVIDHAAKPSAN